MALALPPSNKWRRLMKTATAFVMAAVMALGSTVAFAGAKPGSTAGGGNVTISPQGAKPGVGVGGVTGTRGVTGIIVVPGGKPSPQAGKGGISGDVYK